MTDLTVVKVSELSSLITEIKTVSTRLKNLENKESIRGYSVKETADLLSVSYNTVRKLINEGRLKAHFVNGESNTGKCMIPAQSINQFLNPTNPNQNV